MLRCVSLGDEEASLIFPLLLLTSLIELLHGKKKKKGWNVSLPTRVNSNRGWERATSIRAPLFTRVGGSHLVKGRVKGRTVGGWAASLRKLCNFLRVCFSIPPLTRVSLCGNSRMPLHIPRNSMREVTRRRWKLKDASSYPKETHLNN